FVEGSDYVVDFFNRNVHFFGEFFNFFSGMWNEFVERWVKDDVPNGLCRDDVCFIENVDINPYIKEIDSITLYRWNRVYPRDLSFDTGILANGFTMRETCDFEGYSHEKITKEVFER
ncbi:MAG: hypothetical protein IIX30_02435, partial [Clostridia bacterium]|nr:hypothetical protein [Clostridia bacterium]